MEYEEDLQKYSGETCAARVNSGCYVLPLRDALEDYDKDCDRCDEIKKLAQQKGLTHVVMSGNHFIRACI